jgi:hypothetical protein
VFLEEIQQQMKTDRRKSTHAADNHRQQIDLLIFGDWYAIKNAARSYLKAEPLWTVRSPFPLVHQDSSIAPDGSNQVVGVRA